jgi:positive regulator of sigma E activity
MKDKAFVVNIKEDFAQVEVNCLIESCLKCSVRILCAGRSQSKASLTVRNPLNACPGDEVEIEIPEARYNKVLIILFGSLIISALLGMGLGYLLSPLLPLSSSESSFLGMLFALLVAGFFLFYYFRKKTKFYLYPVITAIIKKGIIPENRPALLRNSCF